MKQVLRILGAACVRFGWCAEVPCFPIFGVLVVSIELIALSCRYSTMQISMGPVVHAVLFHSCAIPSCFFRALAFFRARGAASSAAVQAGQPAETLIKVLCSGIDASSKNAPQPSASS